MQGEVKVRWARSGWQPDGGADGPSILSSIWGLPVWP